MTRIFLLIFTFGLFSCNEKTNYISEDNEETQTPKKEKDISDSLVKIQPEIQDINNLRTLLKKQMPFLHIILMEIMETQQM